MTASDKTRRKRDRAINAALRAGQWELGNVANDLWKGDVPEQSWRELLLSLDYLHDLVAMRFGHPIGPTIDRQDKQ